MHPRDLDPGALVAAPLLSADDMHVAYVRDGQALPVVQGVSFSIPPGAAVGIVGESGSGKSTLARALIGLLPAGAGRITHGSVRCRGELVAPERLRRLRGGFAAMVFQDPLSYLNPLQTIGTQVLESVRLHDAAADPAARIDQLLEQVQLPAAVRHAYPHELSGGMRQRALLAIALGCRPQLLIADEPTTALDVTTQREILTLLTRLRQELGMALLLISHDLGVVAALCDTVHVMRHGRFLESGSLRDVFRAPKDPYTSGLLDAAQARRDADGRFVTMEESFQDTVMARPGPASASASDSAPTSGAAPTSATPTSAATPGPATASRPATTPGAATILELEAIGKTFRRSGGAPFKAVDSVSLSVGKAQTVALVGESGSGKSTLARIALGLLAADTGRVLLHGEDLASLSPGRLREVRTAMQPVFQDSSAAFNPRRTVRQLLSQALPRRRTLLDPRTHLISLLEKVGLRPGTRYLDRLPHELSGGQRQRLSIARALAAEPALIIADEPLSGADVSIRGQILNLLHDLQVDTGVSYLFVTHDIALARAFAHRVAVMFQGQLVEQGDAHVVIDTPGHPYTRRLVEASLRLDAQST